MTPSSAPSPDDLELVSAWLAGDLDDPAAAELEARLRTDRALRRGADDVAAVVTALAGTDDVAPPGGFEARLRQRLDAEATTPLPWDEAAPPAAAGGAVVPLGRLYDARARRTRRWTAVSGVAAAVLVVAGGAAVLVRGGGDGFDGGGAETSAGQAAGGRDLQAADAAGGAAATDEIAAAAPAAAADEEAAEAPLPGAAQEGDETTTQVLTEAAAEEGSEAAAGAERPADEPTEDSGRGDAAGGAPVAGAGSDAAPPAGPVVEELVGDLADEDAVRARFAGRPEVEAFIGRDAAQVEDLARAYADAIRRAPPFSDGQTPAACLDDVLRDAPGPAVPTTVARATFEGRAALAYVVVLVEPGVATAERAEAWIVDDACAVAAFVRLDAAGGGSGE